jgi:hypothetical protein
MYLPFKTVSIFTTLGDLKTLLEDNALASMIACMAAIITNDAMEDVSLSTTSGKENKMGKWDGRSMEPNLRMFCKAVDYALSRGLTWNNMPELRSENGVMHAIQPNGKKLRLEDRKGWEQQSGYAKLVSEMVAMKRKDQTTIEDFVPLSPLRGAAET